MGERKTDNESIDQNVLYPDPPTRVFAVQIVCLLHPLLVSDRNTLHVS